MENNRKNLVEEAVKETRKLEKKEPWVHGEQEFTRYVISEEIDDIFGNKKYYIDVYDDGTIRGGEWCVPFSPLYQLTHKECLDVLMSIIDQDMDMDSSV